MAWWNGIDKIRVMIAPDSGVPVNDTGRFLWLRHPKSGNGLCYFFANGMLHELQWFKQSYGSWFLGDYICEDGSLYVATPIDPVFILLPIFEEARMKKRDDPGKFRQLDEILFVDGYPAFQDLSQMADDCMKVICETRDVGPTTFYRLDDFKVLSWLHYKVCQMKQALLSLGENYAARDEKDTTAYAVSILGEYVPTEPWLRLLCDHLGIDILEATGEGKDDACDYSMEYNHEPSNSFQENKNNKKLDRPGKQTKKAKVETNSKNIREMFSRACKKKG